MKADKIIDLIVSLTILLRFAAGATAFGMWQHSAWAGLFAFCFLMGLEPK